MNDMLTKELDRKEFLKMAGGVGVGIAIAGMEGYLPGHLLSHPCPQHLG